MQELLKDILSSAIFIAQSLINSKSMRLLNAKSERVSIFSLKILSKSALKPFLHVWFQQLFMVVKLPNNFESVFIFDIPVTSSSKGEIQTLWLNISPQLNFNYYQ